MAEPRKLSPEEFRTMQLLELDIKEKMKNKAYIGIGGIIYGWENTANTETGNSHTILISPIGF